jgi:hypothetical protein
VNVFEGKGLNTFEFNEGFAEVEASFEAFFRQKMLKISMKNVSAVCLIIERLTLRLDEKRTGN